MRHFFRFVSRCLQVFSLFLLVSLLLAHSYPLVGANPGSWLMQGRFQHNKPLDTITMSLVGDLMIGSNYPSDDYLPPEEQNILSDAIPLLRKSDLRLGNHEGAIADEVPIYKDCGDGKNCYAFRTPTRLALWYKEAGFNYLNLANNHSFDFGPQGAMSTEDMLTAMGIRHSGTLRQPIDTFTVRNTKVGFVSFSPNRNCLDLNDDSLVGAYVHSARQVCDLLVVFFHGGAEGATKMHVPIGHEMFYDQDRGDLRKFTRLCIDSGADLVVGSGPHVVRGMEMYRGKLIVYSLGNFATYHLFNLKYPMNIAPLLQLSITSKGALISNRVYSFKQRGEGVPKLDTSYKAWKLLRMLSEQDFAYQDITCGKEHQ